MKSLLKVGLVCTGLMTIGLAFSACQDKVKAPEGKRYQFANILDIAYTPDAQHPCDGWFTDAGSWMGFTLPEKGQWVNGFCGPFGIEMESRVWMAQSAVTVGYAGEEGAVFIPDSTSYFPGELYLSAHSGKGSVVQRLNFVDATTALLRIETDKAADLLLTASQWDRYIQVSVEQGHVIGRHPNGERVVLTFAPDVVLQQTDNNYQARVNGTGKPVVVGISFFTDEEELTAQLAGISKLVAQPDGALQANADRWETYLEKLLRTDMQHEYDRVAVKALTTLISNWRTERGGFLHEGIVPSHAVDYFVGFWAWDSWRHSAGIARFEPELAKNSIRAFFDYQRPDGMILDCIFVMPEKNVDFNSKPPLVSWAVDEIYKYTNDKDFVAEMYPKLLAYYKWWYAKRDHNQNGICEFGSTDGRLQAAAYESGMDNAIRFDDAKILKNKGYDDAYSMDQENVDLNSFLALECKLLKKFAALLDIPFDAPDESARIADYFFDKEQGFFFDRRIKDGSFVRLPGCEAYAPLWTQIATQEQVDAMLPMLQDPAKFSTYIPFPTAAADNPKFEKSGYWRGPIWLDQTYFAIRGLRNYGYNELADMYTLQVFDRLDGLKEGKPIHENYATHTGERHPAPHFGWSCVYLMMMYEDYGK